jgi:ribosome-associated toxin RatA of RatAB toxin-antitoxin module
LITAAAFALAPRPAWAEDASFATARIPVPPERAWALITDFERHVGIIPEMLRSSAEWLSEDRVRLRQTKRIAGYTISYTLAVRIDSERRVIEATLDRSEPHDVAVLETTWRVAPHPDGGTHVELRVLSRSGLPVPAWLERRVTDRSTRETLRALAHALVPPADRRLASR